jgi:multicomponent Na+:H+ antiporter subunit G
LSALLDGLSWSCLLAGGAFCLVGAVGMLRMPDLFTRMHAASVVDTLGAGLILLGLLLQAPSWQVGAKLAMIMVLLVFTSPAATHALAKAAVARGLKPQLDQTGDESSNS